MTALKLAALSQDTPPALGQRSVSLCEWCSEPLANPASDYCSDQCMQEARQDDRESRQW